VIANAEIYSRGKPVLTPYPIGFRSNGHFLFFKIFYDGFYSAEGNAMNGKARTYIVGSQPDLVESE
jgi:hypothetical protein